MTVDFDAPARARVETYVMFVQRRAAEPRVDFGGGRYVNSFERRAGEWRIATRTLVMDWVCEAGCEDPRGVLARYRKGSWDRSDPSCERPLVVSRER